MSISRRNALLGASAAVAMAGVPAAVAAKVALAGDAVLLARCEQFHDLYEAAGRVWEKQKAHQTRIEAMDEGGHSTWQEQYAFMEAHGAYKYRGEFNGLWEQTAALANVIFEAPAKTARGVLEKVRILHAARGDYGQDGDDELDACQDNSWFGHVITDLERLAGESRPT